MRQGILPQRNPLMTISQIASSLQEVQAQRARRQAVQQGMRFNQQMQPLRMSAAQEQLQTHQQQDPITTAAMQFKLDQARQQAPFLLRQQEARAKQMENPALKVRGALAEAMNVMEDWKQRYGPNDSRTVDAVNTYNALLNSAKAYAQQASTNANLAPIKAAGENKDQLFLRGAKLGYTVSEMIDLMGKGKLLEALNSGKTASEHYAESGSARVAPPVKVTEDQIAEFESKRAKKKFTTEQLKVAGTIYDAQKTYINARKDLLKLTSFTGWPGKVVKSFNSLMAGLTPQQRHEAQEAYRNYEAERAKLLSYLRQGVGGPAAAREIALLNAAVPENLGTFSSHGVLSTFDRLGQTFANSYKTATTPIGKVMKRPSLLTASGQPAERQRKRAPLSVTGQSSQQNVLNQRQANETSRVLLGSSAPFSQPKYNFPHHSARHKQDVHLRHLWNLGKDDEARAYARFILDDHATR